MPALPDNLIYVCSKVSLIPLWQSLRRQNVPIISRWIDLAEFTENNRAAADDLWHNLVAPDMRRATDLLVYHHAATHVFKGALCEIGMAMGHEIPIHVVSPWSLAARRQAWGSWVAAGNVHHYKTLRTALNKLGYPGVDLN